jgi:hypothetical protein
VKVKKLCYLGEYVLVEVVALKFHFHEIEFPVLRVRHIEKKSIGYRAAQCVRAELRAPSGNFSTK